jgi:predicted PolB exonuclease-like 3'-5' exonuclease
MQLMAEPSVTYLAFDVETVADGALVARIRYPGEKLTPQAAVARYRQELMEKYENDFIPYTFQIPISVAVGKISADYQLIDVAVLDEPQFRPHVITEHFWRGWDRYRRPTLVSFNGRTFDIPLLELAAFRYGVSVPGWFNVGAKSFEQYRNRFNLDAHFDLQEILTNFGSTRFTGGLNLAANLLGKPGKMDVEGHMVQDLYDAGKVAEINDYCRCDLLDTYFVFLRTRVMFGELSLDHEQGLIGETHAWLKKRAKQPGFAAYLQRWGDWSNPWTQSAEG